MNGCREFVCEGCGALSCVTHHRCDSRERAGCFLLEPVHRTYDADELGIDQEEDD